MTKEEFNLQYERLSNEHRWEESILLYRRYVEQCRQSGDPDLLAEALYGLSLELSVHGSEADARAVFDDLHALKKAFAQHNLKAYGEAYALLLHRKVCITDNIDEALSCQEEAIGIYKELGLYDPRGFDIDDEDAFGCLGQLYCYKGDYASGIHYTTLALERALREGESDFILGLYYRRLGIAHLLSGDSQNTRGCIREALLCFERSSQTEPDPYADPEVIDSCRQLLSECDGPLHPADYYWQWLI